MSFFTRFPVRKDGRAGRDADGDGILNEGKDSGGSKPASEAYQPKTTPSPWRKPPDAMHIKYVDETIQSVKPATGVSFRMGGPSMGDVSDVSILHASNKLTGGNVKEAARQMQNYFIKNRLPYKVATTMHRSGSEGAIRISMHTGGAPRPTIEHRFK